MSSVARIPRFLWEWSGFSDPHTGAPGGLRGTFAHSMETSVSSPLVSVLFFVALCGAPAVAAAAQDVASVDKEWLLSYNERDAGAVRRIWSDDARLVATTGKVKTKTEELEDVTSAAPPELKAKWGVTDQIVREYGDTAVVIGRFAQAGTWSGQPFERPYRYTNVYARLGGEWRLVSSQFAKIGE